MADQRFVPRGWAWGTVGLAVVATTAAALTPQQSRAAADPTVPTKVAALLGAKCLTCHNSEKKAGGIDLSTRASAVAAKVTGKDDPATNRFVRAIVSGKMPPIGKLPANEITLLRQWVAGGSVYAKDHLEQVRISDQPLWSLQPVKRPAVPRTRFDSLAKTPVDRFVFARLADKGLRPSRPASRQEWLRRVTVDLTGLPPTPREVTAFLADGSALAFERVVDRLLASPAYGERWGQHWLDVVRYGESHGYEQNHIRPNAWPYRDYVIRSFNEDKPYHRFVREQIAGDVLAKDDPGAAVGTGFLVAGVHDTVGNQTEEGRRLQRVNDLDDMVAATAETFLGLTAGCAKCHDHKFDPIPQRDYYRLSAVFAGVRHGERDLAMPNAAGSIPGFTVFGHRRREDFAPISARFVRFTVLATADGTEPCLDELEIYGTDGAKNVALAENGAKASASSLLPGYPAHQVEHLIDGKLGNPRSWISNEPGRGWAQIELPQATRIGRVVWSRDATPEPRYADRQADAWRIDISDDGSTWKTLVTREKGTIKPGSSGTRAYIGTFSPPDPTFVLRRGDVMQRTDEVGPGALSRVPGYAGELLLAGNKRPETDVDRRLALADWLVDPKNPLTARVMVNRIWHHHFGRGLVATPSDFGHNGEKPTHPELLDWLSRNFVDGGWKIKRLHKLLCLSYVYRQSSGPDSRGTAVDAGNQLLWRMPLRRLEAEAVRDAILATSGKLDSKMGGPSFRLFKYRIVNVAIYEPLEDHGPETWRRSVYHQPARGIRDDLLGTFDCPESSQRTPRRPATTTALQALSLLNGPFMVQQSQYFAERVRKEAGAAPAAQAAHAFRLALGRSPTGDEQKSALQLVAKHGLPALCRALMNANEFLYY